MKSQFRALRRDCAVHEINRSRGISLIEKLRAPTHVAVQGVPWVPLMHLILKDDLPVQDGENGFGKIVNTLTGSGKNRREI